MRILGRGSANGAISILHALGIGKGCSIGIQLSTEVLLLENRVLVEEDRNGILDAVESCWRSEGLPLPNEVGWKVESNIPIGQGLKSSSALACAAIRAANSYCWTGLSDFDIADIAVKSQRLSKCTITGSMDDTMASLSPGWKLVDPTLAASESVIFQGKIDQSLVVILGLRGSRKAEISKNSFYNQERLFQRSLASLMNGSPMDALSSNGMAVAAATDDFEALRISNICIASGAIAAGISGSGPAMAIVCYQSYLDTLEELLNGMGIETISTRFENSEVELEGAS